MKNILLVLNYNNFNQTEKFVKDTLSLYFFDDVIIVDNNSVNNSFQELVECFKSNIHVRVILSPNNNGYAQGNNFGLKYIEKIFSVNDVIYISNPDIGLNLKALVAVNKFIKDNESNVGLVTTSILNQQSTWRLIGYYKSIFIESYLFRKLFHSKYIKMKYYPKMISEKYPVDVVTGAFFATNLSTIIEIDGFDPNTFLYMEEDILAYKIKKINRQSYLLPMEQVTHVGGTSTVDTLSEINQKKILNNSKKYYYKSYMRVGFWGLGLFSIISNIDIGILFLKKCLRGK
ncbi:glycosyltransferase [Weissella paramesenteroides]|uniref:glycosyltransferase n=1 Tax=Weissella paramesenteroides TaxID=1249 RepID=UPI00223B6B03|nr:glycosyltransferase [Weissella paramesenteroides]MCT0484738.1 glycosyltransferase family 2 protein [Weissella paramesenteroides]